MYLLLSLLAFCAGALGQGCVPPPILEGGYYEPVKNIYSYGDEIDYTCETGYNMLGPDIRKCQGFPSINAWIWTGSEPQCEVVDCGAPVIADAVYEVPEITTYQTTMYYRCNQGLTPLGYQVAQCMANGTWSYTECQYPEFFCQEPPSVENASHNGSLSIQQQGATIKYKCDTGFTMVGSDSITCMKTQWSGKLPTCTPVKTVNNIGDKANVIDDNVLPIVAGVMTALILTAILIITVLCIRKRTKEKRQHGGPESVSSASPAASSTPTQIHRHTMGTIRLPHPGDHMEVGPPQYHTLHCQHSHPLNNPDYGKPELPLYGPMDSNTHFRPVLMSCSDNQHSSSPSTVQSEVSAGDTEFHTIRECLGDFRNNNITPNHPGQGTPHAACHAMPHQISFHNHHGMITPRTRTLWTPDGRPYEAVTCPHGVEHLYQPLEHIYEEPHMWTRPLPNPQQSLSSSHQC